MKISIGFLNGLALVFITLKLLGKIDWSWWWVTCPLWVAPVAVVALCVLAVAVFIFVGSVVFIVSLAELLPSRKGRP